MLQVYRIPVVKQVGAAHRKFDEVDCGRFLVFLSQRTLSEDAHAVQPDKKAYREFLVQSQGHVMRNSLAISCFCCE